MTVFADAMDDLFEDDDLSQAASYLPPVGGSAIACSVILNKADQSVDFNGSRQFDEGVIVEVRSSEIASPVRGGTFTIAGVVRSILDDPQSDDPERLIWKCRVK